VTPGFYDATRRRRRRLETAGRLEEGGRGGRVLQYLSA